MKQYSLFFVSNCCKHTHWCDSHSAMFWSVCFFPHLTFTATSTPSLINKQTGIKRQQRWHYTAAVAFPSLPVCDDPYYHQRSFTRLQSHCHEPDEEQRLSGCESNESSNSIFQSLEDYQHQYYIFHNHIKYNTLMPKLFTFSVRFISLWVKHL